MELGEAMEDQRVIADRRQFSWRTIFFGFLRSRRHNLRRDEDADVVFLDWHHPWLFFLAVGTMIFSCLDAFLTLLLLEHGFYEANPIMAAVLEQGTAVFAVTKLFMTGTSILILVFLAKSRFLNRVRTGLILTVFFSLYACLVCYEFVFLMRGL
ncbi:MAG: DUF5658 family protein [Woeseiaceae bacterium]|jgi:hypothetical protein